MPQSQNSAGPIQSNSHPNSTQNGRGAEALGRKTGANPATRLGTVGVSYIRLEKSKGIKDLDPRRLHLIFSNILHIVILAACTQSPASAPSGSTGSTAASGGCTNSYYPVPSGASWNLFF